MVFQVKNFKNRIFLFLLAGMFIVSAASCNKKDYPCPGLGQSNEADISMFDETGKLKSEKDKGRMDRKTGLVKKKKDKRLTAKRKTHI
jgi:hypothetical protein